MARQKLFEYAILYHPRYVKKDEESGIVKKSEIVAPLKMIMANDLAEVQMIAAREVPEKYITDNLLDCVEIAIRPL